MPPRLFSWRTRQTLAAGAPFPLQPAVTCGITYTTLETHRLLRDNLHRSPLFQGDIVGRGPRYCPSLEDKVVRFAARERHQVFLEPEGPDSPLVYPAGLSTSMPADVQLEFLRTIPGLEQVEVVRFGYAVEYDYAPPTQLPSTLETKAVRGPVLRRPAQRHLRLRGGRLPGAVRGHQRGAAGEGRAAAAARPATRRTARCWWTSW